MLIFYLVATKDSFISRIFFFNFLPWLYIALLFFHHFLPEFLARGFFVGKRRHCSLVPPRKPEDKIPVLGGADRFRSAIQEHGVTQVIMLEFPQFTELNRNLIATWDQLGVRLMIVSDLEEKLGHPVTHCDDDGFRFVGLREEPLENPFNRAIDFFLALPIMHFVFPPLAVIVWLAQRSQSPGPLFHKQTRAGIQNRRFESGNSAPCTWQTKTSRGRRRARTRASMR